MLTSLACLFGPRSDVDDTAYRITRRFEGTRVIIVRPTDVPGIDSRREICFERAEVVGGTVRAFGFDAYDESDGIPLDGTCAIETDGAEPSEDDVAPLLRPDVHLESLAGQTPPWLERYLPWLRDGAPLHDADDFQWTDGRKRFSARSDLTVDERARVVEHAGRDVGDDPFVVRAKTSRDSDPGCPLCESEMNGVAGGLGSSAWECKRANETLYDVLWADVVPFGGWTPLMRLWSKHKDDSETIVVKLEKPPCRR